jgi:hypothetical protein
MQDYNLPENSVPDEGVTNEDFKINFSMGNVLNIQEDLTRKEDLFDFCTYSISQVKQFMAILYGSCVRFYSTVVEWEFLQ